MRNADNKTDRLIMLMEILNPNFKRSMIKEIGVLKEVQQMDDFFYFIENDPRLNTFSYVYYTSLLDRGLAKKSTNPMVGKFIKNTRYKFSFGQTYGRAVEIKNPEHEMQQRKGDYDKVDGYKVLETDRNGNLVLPIVPLQTKSNILVLDESGNLKEKIESSQIQEKYGHFFQPSFFNRSGSSSGVDFRPLKVDSISKISAGGAVWENPNFIYQQYKQYM